MNFKIQSAWLFKKLITSKINRQEILINDNSSKRGNRKWIERESRWREKSSNSYNEKNKWKSKGKDKNKNCCWSNF